MNGLEPPTRMEHDERQRVRKASFSATRAYPGPVGELLVRELMSWEDFGYRLGSRGLIMRVVEDIETRAAEISG